MMPEEIQSPISIHALREEGDWLYFQLQFLIFISIHALREEGDRWCYYTTNRAKNFYPRPPRGGRRTVSRWATGSRTFLSTPSARRATNVAKTFNETVGDFYPRPPRGGRQQKQRENTLLLSHYTPLCTNCKEMLAKQTAKSHRYLRKRLVFRCEASRKTMCAAGSHWPDIKRSARCLGQILGAVQRARPSSGSCCPAGRTADCPRRGRSGRSALL